MPNPNNIQHNHTERTVVILQPGYLPWLGFFDQLSKSDVFVYYDDVQFDKNGWRNRNRIKTSQGWQWLTVPVQAPGGDYPILVKDTRITNQQNWAHKHKIALQTNYSKAPFFDAYFPEIEAIYNRKWDFLIDLDVHLIDYICRQINLERQLEFSSRLGITGGKTERLVKICRHFGASRFLEGDAGRNYIEDDLFTQANIRLEYHHYKHPEYSQLYGAFAPYMSIIDLLLNHGPASLDILVDVRS